MLRAFCLIILFSSAVRADGRPALEKLPPAVYHRTAFLGDSITDGNTYPQLIRTAIANAGLPKMIDINAGIGGDTIAGMHARLERDVLAFHPTLVTLNAGANDTFRNVTPELYEKDLRAIVERLKKEQIPLILLTPNIMGGKARERGQKNLDAYEAILRQVAKENGLRVAEVNARQQERESAGQAMLAPDGVHPNWEGQQMIARAVLDAMGYAEVKVPEKIVNTPLPGIISQWRVRPMAAKESALTEASVAEIKPDASWLTITLPETQPIPDFDSVTRWLDDYRTLGASVSLRQKPHGNFIGIASLPSDKAAKVQFHTGGDLREVWLNGTRIYQNIDRRGYHIGRESVDAELKKGENSVVIKTGPVFFLSVTEGPIW